MKLENNFKKLFSNSLIVPFCLAKETYYLQHTYLLTNFSPTLKALGGCDAPYAPIGASLVKWINMPDKMLCMAKNL